MMEDFFLSDRKAFWVWGAFQGLLIGLKTDSDFALEVKVDAIKVEATIASWVFFCFGWFELGLEDEGVMILGEESSITSIALSSLKETFLEA